MNKERESLKNKLWEDLDNARRAYRQMENIEKSEYYTRSLLSLKYLEGHDKLEEEVIRLREALKDLVEKQNLESPNHKEAE